MVRYDFSEIIEFSKKLFQYALKEYCAVYVCNYVSFLMDSQG